MLQSISNMMFFLSKQQAFMNSDVLGWRAAVSHNSVTKK